MPNPITKKQNTPQSVAEILKQGREKKGSSLEEFSQASGISLQNLKYLESGDYDRLPSAIYVEHFLSKYADYFNIPKKVLISNYRKENTLLPDQYAPAQIFKSRKRGAIITPKVVIAAVVFLAVIIVGGYFWYQISGLLGSPMLIVENPDGDIITTETSINISGYSQQDSQVFLNGKEINAVDGRFNELFVLQQGTNTVEIKSINKFGKETIEVRRIIKN